MKINNIIKEAGDVADKNDFYLIERDRTDNIINLNLVIDNGLFIQIYANAQKDKVNLALIFKNRRLYGFDSEGGKYHCHPFDAPDQHVFVDESKSIKDFVQESIRFLEDKEML
ncbi:MAG: hypothetical protein AB1611_08085 [bacterium]